MSPLSALLPENPFWATTNPTPQPCSSRTGPAPTDRSAAPLRPQLYSQLGVGPGSRKPPPGLQPVLHPPQVLLLDLSSGAVLWSQALPGLPGDPPSTSLPTADHRSAFFFWGVHKTTGSNQTVESWVLADSSGQAPWLGACKETEAPWGGQTRLGLGGWAWLGSSRKTPRRVRQGRGAGGVCRAGAGVSQDPGGHSSGRGLGRERWPHPPPHAHTGARSHWAPPVHAPPHAARCPAGA